MKHSLVNRPNTGTGLNKHVPGFRDEFLTPFDLKNEIAIEAEIAGLGKEDVSVEYEDGLLTITGNKKDEVEEQGVKYIYRELKRSSFRRSFQIDETNLEVENISAKFDNGILNVSIPKKEVAAPKAKKVKIL